MKTITKSLEHGVTFKLIGYGSILQVFYHGKLWTTLDLLVQHQYISDTVERIKKEVAERDKSVSENLTQ